MIACLLDTTTEEIKVSQHSFESIREFATVGVATGRTEGSALPYCAVGASARSVHTAPVIHSVMLRNTHKHTHAAMQVHVDKKKRTHRAKLSCRIKKTKTWEDVLAWLHKRSSTLARLFFIHTFVADEFVESLARASVPS